MMLLSLSSINDDDAADGGIAPSAVDEEGVTSNLTRLVL
jgi:hypothetical protein